MLFKTLYNKYPYFFNLLVVLVLLMMIRILDQYAWIPPDPKRTSYILISHLFEFLSFFPLVLLIIYSYRWALARKQVILHIVLILVFAIFGPTLVQLLTTSLEISIWSDKIGPVTFDILKKYTPGCSAVILFLSATFYLTHLWLQFTRQRDEVNKAENLTREIRLKMLHYQINPHFLFNVLNSIHALIDENPDKAKNLVVEMSDYYRSTLNKQDQTISIEKEIQSVMKYLEIQKTRFEEGFEFEISVDEAARAVLIPSFVIHLLIENAVKYGIGQNKQQLILRLSVSLFEKVLRIRVSNTGKLMVAKVFIQNNTDETSHSIEIIKSRLALLYEEHSSFRLIEDNGWVHATIELTLPGEKKAGNR
ncbi:MAG: histidine kinase [Bacteroidales bacterium]|jgi:sensor histidine kinase YesM